MTPLELVRSLPKSRQVLKMRRRLKGRLSTSHRHKAPKTRAKVKRAAPREHSVLSTLRLQTSRQEGMTKVTSSPTRQLITSSPAPDFDPLAGGFSWLLTRASWLSLRLAVAEWTRSRLAGRIRDKTR